MLSVETFTGGFTATNGYLCQTQLGWFLIDAPDGSAEWLRRRNVQLAALILTHAHFDHVLDAAALQRDHQCPILAFASPTPELTLERFLGVLGGSFSVPTYTVTRFLGEGDAVSLAGVDFSIHHIPGHSTDSITLHAPAEAVLFSGDVLMAGGVGRVDFPGGSMAALASGIRSKLYVLPEETVVYPGHGPATTIGDERKFNPYVRPSS